MKKSLTLRLIALFFATLLIFTSAPISVLAAAAAEGAAATETTTGTLNVPATDNTTGTDPVVSLPMDQPQAAAANDAGDAAIAGNAAANDTPAANTSDTANTSNDTSAATAANDTTAANTNDTVTSNDANAAAAANDAANTNTAESSTPANDAASTNAAESNTAAAVSAPSSVTLQGGKASYQNGDEVTTLTLVLNGGGRFSQSLSNVKGNDFDLTKGFENLELLKVDRISDTQVILTVKGQVTNLSANRLDSYNEALVTIIAGAIEGVNTDMTARAAVIAPVLTVTSLDGKTGSDKAVYSDAATTDIQLTVDNGGSPDWYFKATDGATGSLKTTDVILGGAFAGATLKSAPQVKGNTLTLSLDTAASALSKQESATGTVTIPKANTSFGQDLTAAIPIHQTTLYAKNAIESTKADNGDLNYTWTVLVNGGRIRSTIRANALTFGQAFAKAKDVTTTTAADKTSFTVKFTIASADVDATAANGTLTLAKDNLLYDGGGKVGLDLTLTGSDSAKTIEAPAKEESALSINTKKIVSAIAKTVVSSLIKYYLPDIKLDAAQGGGLDLMRLAEQGTVSISGDLLIGAYNGDNWTMGSTRPVKDALTQQFDNMKATLETGFVQQELSAQDRDKGNRLYNYLDEDSKAMAQIQTHFYDNFNANENQALALIAGNQITTTNLQDINNRMGQVYSDGNIAYLSDYNMLTKTLSGNAGAGGLDVFTVYGKAQSYEYDFDSQTLINRKKFNVNIMRFMTEGFITLDKALVYDYNYSKGKMDANNQAIESYTALLAAAETTADEKQDAEAAIQNLKSENTCLQTAMNNAVNREKELTANYTTLKALYDQSEAIRLAEYKEVYGTDDTEILDVASATTVTKIDTMHAGYDDAVTPAASECGTIYCYRNGKHYKANLQSANTKDLYCNASAKTPSDAAAAAKAAGLISGDYATIDMDYGESLDIYQGKKCSSTQWSYVIHSNRCDDMVGNAPYYKGDGMGTNIETAKNDSNHLSLEQASYAKAFRNVMPLYQNLASKDDYLALEKWAAQKSNVPASQRNLLSELNRAGFLTDGQGYGQGTTVQNDPLFKGFYIDTNGYYKGGTLWAFGAADDHFYRDATILSASGSMDTLPVQDVTWAFYHNYMELGDDVHEMTIDITKGEFLTLQNADDAACSTVHTQL